MIQPDNKPSLAARVHALLSSTKSGVWAGTMSVEKQFELFGVELAADFAIFVVRLWKDSTIHTSAFDADRNLLVDKTLTSIQEMIEGKVDQDIGHDFDDWDDGLTGLDYYRVFPRDESAFLIIENKVLGRKEETVDVSLHHARDNFARRHGYGDWAEMRALAPEGDRAEDWTVEWTDGDPEESRRRQIVHLEAERDELVAKLRDGAQEKLAEAFLDKQAKLFDFAVKARDPEAYRDLEEDCHLLRERHLEAVEANRMSFSRWKDVTWLLYMYIRRDKIAA